MLITDKGNLEVKKAFFAIGKRKTIGKKQSKTNRRAVGLDTAFLYRVHNCVQKVCILLKYSYLCG